MTDATTIKLEVDVKAALDRENLDRETYSETVARLLGQSNGKVWTEDEIEAVVTRLIKEYDRQRSTDNTAFDPQKSQID